MDRNTALKYVVDAQGHSQGVFLDEELWRQVCSHVLAVLARNCPVEQLIPEPMADFELLEKYWDFRYELPSDVCCETCGASTPNWQTDEPRKFVLRAANMGGLLVFECKNCGSRITKRHFKDKVTVTCSAQGCSCV
ncbi:MAG: hypothetical protein GX055_11155 [Desulfovibrionales bacterium]|nr:hypothetical protein [Desulfovibrionales bacterium]